MINIFNIPYNKRILIDENKITSQRVYFEKTRFKAKEVDQYFIKIYQVNKMGGYINKGYLYFYLDLLKKESNFIGIYTPPNFRNEGLAQLLISYWVTICLNNGIYKLDTIHKQRKPFIIYLLKKFKFDLLNVGEYDSSPNTICICKKDNSDEKSLFFKNPLHAEKFRNSAINRSDNYRVLDSIEEDTEVLDQVLLFSPYTSKDDESAYNKSMILLERFKRS